MPRGKKELAEQIIPKLREVVVFREQIHAAKQIRHALDHHAPNLLLDAQHSALNTRRRAIQERREHLRGQSIQRSPSF